MIELSTDQQEASDVILDRCEAILDGAASPDGDNTVVLAGAAGTGKTTITRQLLDYLEEANLSVHLMAPTWRAARRLSALTDRPAMSIHKSIYEPPREEEGRLNWSLDPFALHHADVVLLDEGSMVGKSVAADVIASTRKKTPILVVADYMQLPPIAEEGEEKTTSPWGFRVQEPDARLTKVHRVALGNPLLELATATREKRKFNAAIHSDIDADKGFTFWNVGWGNSWLDWLVETTAPWYSLDASENSLSHIVITGRNDTRKAVNARFRRHFRKSGPPEGEPILVLTNQGAGGCFNGDILNAEYATIMRTRNGNPYLSIETSEGVYLDAPCDEDGLPIQLPSHVIRGAARRNENLVNIDFGYAATCHKMQGSQARRVTVALFDSDFMKGDDLRRWSYTAYTRAEEKLLVMWR